jgi:hypothetical protein
MSRVWCSAGHIGYSADESAICANYTALGDSDESRSFGDASSACSGGKLGDLR